MKRPRATGLRLARTLGITGLGLSVTVTVATWLGLLMTLAPAQKSLDLALAQLERLESQLATVQRTLAPLEQLGRPQTVAAVRTLADLTQTAQRTPLAGALLGQEMLGNAVALTRAWEEALSQGPGLTGLTEARQTVRHWQEQVRSARRTLDWMAVALGLLVTLLCAWFAAGQWMLYRHAREQLGRTKG
ncbi:hypothetical protein GCM10008955_17040 [Deinococcus malanensis]|uniref:Uncharacterized protein n=1 Tax=Deinococcus malanensis TaxID=1706855 RepID=A0ABQ2EWB7_9DEIO|nr:hypothetical protein [Deinococcus malanensis]GGK24049.1 hypothetical protein GCM10008955_17040 [Deinococcus malanensis]